MKEILFKGLRTDGKGWVEGDLINLDDRIMIADKGMAAYDTGNSYEEALQIECIEVIPKTIGQFTNKFDRNKIRIFGNDIIQFVEAGEICKCQVLFIDGKWTAGRDFDGEDMILMNGFDCLSESEVIGNIHEK